MRKKLLISACLLGVGCRYDGRRVPRAELEPLKDRFELIPVCPELLGGLPTPRPPSERVGDRVLMQDGRDVTDNFLRGAEETYYIARALGADIALLKERSPSCGKGRVYDGSFTSTLTDRDGCTAEYLIARGVRVFGESEAELLFEESDPV